MVAVCRLRSQCRVREGFVRPRVGVVVLALVGVGWDGEGEGERRLRKERAPMAQKVKPA